MRRLILFTGLALAAASTGAPALADDGPLVYASSHTNHEGMGHGKGSDGQHGGKHPGDKNGHGDNTGGNARTSSKSKPNDVVNLLLVLLIPAGMGAIGGRMLRKTRVKPAG